LGKLCLMVSGGHDHAVKLWNVCLQGGHSSVQPLRALQGHSESVMCVRISTSGGLIASSSGDKTVRLWEVCVKKYIRFKGLVSKCFRSFSLNISVIISSLMLYCS
jgi:WD40 repeat protein